MSETILKYLAPSVALLMFVLTLSVHAKTNAHAVKLFGKVLAVVFGLAFLGALGWLCWGWLTTRTNWPRWALVLLWFSGPVLCGAVLIVVVWFRDVLAGEATQDSHTIEGLRWVWVLPNIEKTLMPQCPQHRVPGRT